MYNYNIYGMDYTATKLVDVIDRFLAGNAKTAEFVYRSKFVKNCSEASACWS